MLHVGKDAFKVEQGSWSTIGADALLVADGEFIPDFCGYVSTPEVKLLRISTHATNETEGVRKQKRASVTSLSGGVHAHRRPSVAINHNGDIDGKHASSSASENAAVATNAETTSA